MLVAALAWILPLHGIPKEAAMHAALASSLASIVLTAASSARAHARRGSVLWPTVAWMVPGLLLCTVVGLYQAYKYWTTPAPAAVGPDATQEVAP